MMDPEYIDSELDNDRRFCNERQTKSQIVSKTENNKSGKRDNLTVYLLNSTSRENMASHLSACLPFDRLFLFLFHPLSFSTLPGK